MRQEFLPFARPAITEGDIDAVVAVMRSGWVAGALAPKLWSVCSPNRSARAGPWP